MPTLEADVATLTAERDQFLDMLNAMAVTLAGMKLPLSGTFSFRREDAAATLRDIVRHLEGEWQKITAERDAAVAEVEEACRLNCEMKELFDQVCDERDASRAEAAELRRLDGAKALAEAADIAEAAARKGAR